MNIIRIDKNNSNYPEALNLYLTNTAPKVITTIGSLEILKNKTLAVFSSAKCPGKIILKTYDLMHDLRDKGVTVISGFHSPMEQECLNILLKGKQPVIVCPARSIEGMRIKAEFKKPLEDGRLLFISMFTEKKKRISSDKSLERNRFVAAIADKIFVPYAEPNSKTETFCRELIEKGKTVLTIDSRHNKNLIALGAAVIDIEARQG
jgi:predicted Rossmann fold nucleotide-binding protein DprA/Smf involved in DNA uptake